MNLIVNAADTQFKLSDSGEILFQKIPNNPLPGDVVAKLAKGNGALAPKIEPLPGQEEAQERLKGWLAVHIATTLEPLINLKVSEEELPAPVQGICDRLFETLGIIHREELADFIGQLDADMRAPLRARKIKMGPLFVFLPDLNKPAAVRLKAVLWSLYNGEPLPPPTPKDGVVSFVIDPETVNRKFHQVAGYPVFGPRAIRIDMLERVVTLVYDSAKEGKFQAQTQMAEWLGCSLEDLYAILRAMGHKQIPAEPKPETEAPAEGEAEVKPELAWFWIKKGRASEKPVRAKPKKPEVKKAENPKKKVKGERKAKEPKTYEFGAKEKKPEDSPFAILQQLKK